METSQSVLDFWFAESSRPFWFKRSADFDRSIRDDYLGLWESARDGECRAWEATPEGALGLVIVLDQFPRNLFREDARSFSTDAAALAVSERAIDAGFDQRIEPRPRQFLYMPYMHSEQLDEQIRACELFGGPDMPGPEWAEKHKVIIERFGRFPHRNEVLGRVSTEEELEFLKGPGSSF